MQLIGDLVLNRFWRLFSFPIPYISFNYIGGLWSKTYQLLSLGNRAPAITSQCSMLVYFSTYHSIKSICNHISSKWSNLGFDNTFKFLLFPTLPSKLFLTALLYKKCLYWGPLFHYEMIRLVTLNFFWTKIGFANPPDLAKFQVPLAQSEKLMFLTWRCISTASTPQVLFHLTPNW